MVIANQLNDRLKHARAALCAVAIIVVTPGLADAGTVILVRHAEKEIDDSKNPNLTAAGRERAAALVEVVRRAGIAAVYSTDLCRTAQTAEPIAASLGLPLRIQGVSESEADPLAQCSPELTITREALATTVTGAAGLAAHLRDAHPADTVLVVGHSDTIPAIIAALIGPQFELTIEDEAYGDLFVVEAPALFGEPSLIRARFGQ